MTLPANERVRTSGRSRGAGHGGLCGGDGGLAFDECLVIEFGNGVDLVIGEAGELAEAAGQDEAALVVVAARSTEAEELVDDLLELERLFAAARISSR